ncbi:hypothetical protein CDD83_8242 [Cordyceps sp. RAO-2017]|nr:hypothetical protein CDD83_8242 [Cordyceps sp. RAO-2017]
MAPSLQALAAALLGLASAAAASPRLNVAMTLESASNGVSVSPDNRQFLVFPPLDGTEGPQVAERTESGLSAYPNEAWNSYSSGKNPARHFLRANAQRIGPDGALWVVDTGSPPSEGRVVLPGGPKLVKIDLASNTVSRVYLLGNVSRPNSFVDDVRFHPCQGKAYLTDAGAPGLIVLDLGSGEAKRMLDDHPSTRGYMPISGEGSLLYGTDGKPAYLHADQLEVSPDGRWFYYQPANGGMSRIETKHLDRAFHDAKLRGELGRYVEPFALTPSTGGTAIDAEGNIYVSDTDRLAIQRIRPSGKVETLIQDDRLVWVDAMWVDSRGQLWLPAAQLNRGAPFNGGKSHIQKPVYVFTFHIGVGPPKIDHL